MSEKNESNPLHDRPAESLDNGWPERAIDELIVLVEGNAGKLFGEDQDKENPHQGYQSLVLRFEKLYETAGFVEGLTWQEVKQKYKEVAKNQRQKGEEANETESQIITSHTRYITLTEKMIEAKTGPWSVLSGEEGGMDKRARGGDIED